MTIERMNQKRNHERQQLQQEIQLMKRQIEHRSKSQLDMHENRKYCTELCSAGPPGERD